MILKAAEEAGLLEGDKHYPLDTIADAATTVFTITAGGETHTVSVYALDATEGPGIDAAPNVPAEEREARLKLAKFQGKLMDYISWLPETAIANHRPRTRSSACRSSANRPAYKKQTTLNPARRNGHWTLRWRRAVNRLISWSRPAALSLRAKSSTVCWPPCKTPTNSPAGRAVARSICSTSARFYQTSKVARNHSSNTHMLPGTGRRNGDCPGPFHALYQGDYSSARMSWSWASNRGRSRRNVFQTRFRSIWKYW
jgi:hypothetical protein